MDIEQKGHPMDPKHKEHSTDSKQKEEFVAVNLKLKYAILRQMRQNGAAAAMSAAKYPLPRASRQPAQEELDVYNSAPARCIITEILNTHIVPESFNGKDECVRGPSLWCVQFSMCTSCVDELQYADDDVDFSGRHTFITIRLCNSCNKINKSMSNYFWTNVGRELHRYRSEAHAVVRNEQEMLAYANAAIEEQKMLASANGGT